MNQKIIMAGDWPRATGVQLVLKNFQHKEMFFAIITQWTHAKCVMNKSGI